MQKKTVDQEEQDVQTVQTVLKKVETNVQDVEEEMTLIEEIQETLVAEDVAIVEEEETAEAALKATDLMFMYKAKEVPRENLEEQVCTKSLLKKQKDFSFSK